MSKTNSRWHLPGVVSSVPRYDGKRTVETARWVKHPDGGKRLERKAVTEILFVARAAEPYGWKNGAKVRKI